MTHMVQRTISMKPPQKMVIRLPFLGGNGFLRKTFVFENNGMTLSALRWDEAQDDHQEKLSGHPHGKEGEGD